MPHPQPAEAELHPVTTRSTSSTTASTPQTRLVRYPSNNFLNVSDDSSELTLEQARAALEAGVDRARAGLDAMLTRGSIVLTVATGALALLASEARTEATLWFGILALLGVIFGVLAIMPLRAPAWRPTDEDLIQELRLSERDFTVLQISHLQTLYRRLSDATNRRGWFITISIACSAIAALTMTYTMSPS